MSKVLFLNCLLFSVIHCTGQKIFCTIGLKEEFSGISHSKEYEKKEFRPAIPIFNQGWKIDLTVRSEQVLHKFAVEQSVLEKNFRIINKFLSPPNTGQPGIPYATFATGIDHFIFSYSIQKDAKKENSFLFHSKIRLNYAVGLGISFNRSGSYYETRDAGSSGGFQDAYTYIGYEALHHREGIGLFVKGSGGFDFINTKGKRRFSINVFYNQGIKNMVSYDIHYQYGISNDPSRLVDVPHQVLKNKGTAFGLTMGIPITLKK